MLTNRLQRGRPQQNKIQELVNRTAREIFEQASNTKQRQEIISWNHKEIADQMPKRDFIKLVSARLKEIFP